MTFIILLYISFITSILSLFELKKKNMEKNAHSPNGRQFNVDKTFLPDNSIFSIRFEFYGLFLCLVMII